MLLTEKVASSRQEPSRFYRLYGLCLRSHFPLPFPELKNCSTAEVEIAKTTDSLLHKVRHLTPIKSQETDWSYSAIFPDGSVYLRWNSLFEFLVSADGRLLTGHPLTDASGESFHTYLLAPALSFALLKQGVEPLHSTVVVIDGQAVAFVGDSGAGKSTLGAAFVQAGYSLLTDDLLAVKEKDGGFMAYPGPCRIKLFPEIARSLFGARVKGIPMNNRTPKLIIPLTARQYCHDAVPLKAIYVLNQSLKASHTDKVRVRRISPRHAFVALIKNTFNATMTDAERLKRQFDLVSSLVSKIPVKLISYPRLLDSLSSVRESVLKNLKA